MRAVVLEFLHIFRYIQSVQLPLVRLSRINERAVSGSFFFAMDACGLTGYYSHSLVFRGGA